MMGLVGGAARLADTGPATQSRRRSSAGGCAACFVPVEPRVWDLSMEMPCFMDERGILGELSMKSACFMDEGRVLVCLSMKVPCFMDERGFEGGVHKIGWFLKGPCLKGVCLGHGGRF